MQRAECRMQTEEVLELETLHSALCPLHSSLPRVEPLLIVHAPSDVLIKEKLVPVGVHGDEAGGAGRALICFARELNALRLQLTLELANIRERRQLLGILVPARVEGHEVSLEHALKKTDDV